MGGPSSWVGLWRDRAGEISPLTPHHRPRALSQPCLRGPGSLVFSEEGLSGERASCPFSCGSQNQAGPRKLPFLIYGGSIW